MSISHVWQQVCRQAPALQWKSGKNVGKMVRDMGMPSFKKIRNEWLGIRDWGLGVISDWGSSVSSSRAQPRDLYCPEGISVYELRENDVLVLPHIRR